MDRIAIISDIHGNIPALQAVLKDIEERDITQIICLGDLAGKGPDPDLAVDLVRKHCNIVIRGNWDDSLGNVTNAEFALWHQQKLGRDRLEYLRNLPFSTEFLMSGRLVRLFHASAQSVFHRVYPCSSFEERSAMFSNTESTENLYGTRRPDIVGYGDIHGTYIQNFQGRTLFNAGSVGNPLDITQSSYVILEGSFQSANYSSFGINFIRVPYNIELAVERAKISGMPELEEYILELQTAIYRNAKK